MGGAEENGSETNACANAALGCCAWACCDAVCLTVTTVMGLFTWLGVAAFEERLDQTSGPGDVLLLLLILIGILATAVAGLAALAVVVAHASLVCAGTFGCLCLACAAGGQAVALGVRRVHGRVEAAVHPEIGKVRIPNRIITMVQIEDRWSEPSLV